MPTIIIKRDEYELLLKKAKIADKIKSIDDIAIARMKEIDNGKVKLGTQKQLERYMKKRGVKIGASIRN